jgi:hypothetical protein
MNNNFNYKKYKENFLILFLLIILPIIFIYIILNNNNFFINIKKYKINEESNFDYKKIFIAEENQFEQFLNQNKNRIPNFEEDENFKTYLIKWGDTLFKIKKKFKLNFSQYKKLLEINNIKDPNKIISGEKIIIPNK